MKTLASWVGRWPRILIAAWVAAVLTAFALSLGALGTGLFDRLKSGIPAVAGEANTAQQLLQKHTVTGPQVWLSLTEIDLTDPEVAEKLTYTTNDVLNIEGVASVIDPFTFPDGLANPLAAPFINEDRDGILYTVELDRDLDDVERRDLSERVMKRLDKVEDTIPGSTSHTGGVDLLIRTITDQVQKDLTKGEAIALPASLLIMIVVFGGFLTAGLPIVGAIAAIAGALSTLLGFTYFMDLDASVVNVVTVLGLGLCIDYGLLLVSRYREELRALSPGPEALTQAQALQALQTTLSTAGRTVMFSGVTVGISLAGLMWFDADILRGIGAAGASVVGVALLVALTLVPAIMYLSAQRLIRPSRMSSWPLIQRLGDLPPKEGRFSALARWVQRRPWTVLTVVTLILAVLTAPALNLKMIVSGIELLPKDNNQRQFFEHFIDEYPIAALPPIVVLSETATADEANAYAEELRSVDEVEFVNPPIPLGNDDVGRVWLIGVGTEGGNGGDDTIRVIEHIQDNRPDFDTVVGGQTSQLIDYQAELARHAGLAVGSVLLATLVLLFLMTGSLLVPIKALLMNVLSLGATLGVLVWIFQYGNLENLLNFDSVGAIEANLPPLVLAFAFGLSMDYEVFLLSRIKEQRDKGDSNDEAVVNGLQASGRIITSAAIIIAVVFLGFVAGDLLVVKENGTALTMAVLLDASLVRMLLVPATMTLLGEWNWWAPAPLRRLHDRFGISE